MHRYFESYCKYSRTQFTNGHLNKTARKIGGLCREVQLYLGILQRKAIYNI